MVPETMRTILKVLAWSFQALSSGVFPASDHTGKLFGKDHHPQRAACAGKTLAGGYIGCWGELRGDWKFLKEAVINCKSCYTGLESFRTCLCNLTRIACQSDGPGKAACELG